MPSVKICIGDFETTRVLKYTIGYSKELSNRKYLDSHSSTWGKYKRKTKRRWDKYSTAVCKQTSFDFVK